MRKLSVLSCLIIIFFAGHALATNFLTIDMDGWIVPKDTTNWNSGNPTVVGWASNGTLDQSFVWTTGDTGPVFLAPVAGGNPTTAASYAYGISTDGSVIAGLDCGGAWRAVEYHRGSAATVISTDGSCDEAYGLSQDGSHAMGWSNASGTSLGAAEMLTTTNSTVKDVTYGYVAYGSSSDGSYVVGTAGGGQAKKGFIDRNGTEIYTASSVDRSCILYISDDGDHAVGICDADGFNVPGTNWFNGDYIQLYDWNGSSYVKTSLPAFATAKGYGANKTVNAGELTGMSADGRYVVGTVSTVSGGWQTFLYDWTTNTMYDKGDIVSMYGLNVPSGQAIEYIMGISPDGQTIVGLMTGDIAGHDGFVAHIPEPATIVLLGLGGLALIRRRKH